MTMPSQARFERIISCGEEVQALWDSALSLLREEEAAMRKVREVCSSETTRPRDAAAAVREFEAHWNDNTKLLDWYARVAIPNAEAKHNEARLPFFGEVHRPVDRLYKMHDRNLEMCPCRKPCRTSIGVVRSV